MVLGNNWIAELDRERKISLVLHGLVTNFYRGIQAFPFYLKRIDFEFRFLESNRGMSCPFCIENCKVDNKNPFPKAHTCFNRLNLPLYQTKEIMANYLKTIVNNNLEGVYGMDWKCSLFDFFFFFFFLVAYIN